MLLFPTLGGSVLFSSENSAAVSFTRKESMFRLGTSRPASRARPTCMCGMAPAWDAVHATHLEATHRLARRDLFGPLRREIFANSAGGLNRATLKPTPGVAPAPCAVSR